MSQANVIANSTAIKTAEGARLTDSNCGAQFSLGSDTCGIILHQRRFVSLFASNFWAFRSICSGTNSLPSSEYNFQRDWAIIFIQIASVMNRLHIETSKSGDALCRCHKFLNRTNVSWICFFVSFGVQEKKIGRNSCFVVSVFRCLVMSDRWLR